MTGCRERTARNRLGVTVIATALMVVPDLAQAGSVREILTLLRSNRAGNDYRTVEAARELRTRAGPGRFDHLAEALVHREGWSELLTLEVATILMEWRGPEATDVLAQSFDQEPDDYTREGLATLVVAAQLEPDKPTEAPPRDVSDPSYCAPHPSPEPARIPIVHREVERLLDPRLGCYLRLVGWDVRLKYVRQGPFAPLLEWAESLRDPSARATFWRRVLEQLDGEVADRGLRARDAAEAELAKALGAVANSKVREDPGAACDLLDEAIEMLPVQGHRALLERLQRRAWRLESRGVSVEAPIDPDLVGSYSRSTGYGGSTISLLRNGMFIFESTSDAIDMCSGGRYLAAGRYFMEGEYIVLSFPLRHGHQGIEDDQYLPVRWGSRTYLIDEGEIIALCSSIHQGEEQARRYSRFHVRLSGPSDAAGDPDVPEAWEDYVLRDPIEARIIEVDDDGRIGLDVGWSAGLRVGMELMGGRWNSDPAFGKWVVVYVGDEASVAEARMRYTGEIGLRVCTRFDGE